MLLKEIYAGFLTKDSIATKPALQGVTQKFMICGTGVSMSVCIYL